MSKLKETQIEEINAIKKNLSKVKLRIAFCYPSIYKVGMSSLGLQLIYQLWNSYEEVSCERAFLPLKETTEPYTLESNQPLRKMDVIAFTMQYEEDYTNILEILERSKIPLESNLRDNSHPLILAGGPCAQANPVPMEPFIDAFMIGDLEPVCNQLINEGLLSSNNRLNRLGILDSFSWMWVPSLNEDKLVKFAPKGNLDDYFYPTKQIIPQIDEEDPWLGPFGKTFLLEVVRGCNRNCSFCLVGKIEHPKRERSLDKLIEIYKQGINECNVNKLTLIGSGISDYKPLEELCQNIVNDNLVFSLPAIRADKITEELMKTLVQAKQKTITSAPEAGTEELRKKICKEISDDEILQAVNNASNGNLTKIKNYFILGLPNETERDIDAISDLTTKMVKIGKNIKQFKISAGFFVPKPRTFFQDESLFSLHALLTKEKLLRKSLSKINKVQCEIANPKWAQIQTILSISGKEISSALKLAAKLGGSIGAWHRAFNEYKIPIVDIIEKKRIIKEHPWEFIKL